MVYSEAEATAVKIGSPIGTTIVKAKVKKHGVKVKAKGTPSELLTVAAALIDEVSWVGGVPVEDVLQYVYEQIVGAETVESYEIKQIEVKGN